MKTINLPKLQGRGVLSKHFTFSIACACSMRSGDMTTANFHHQYKFKTSQLYLTVSMILQQLNWSLVFCSSHRQESRTRLMWSQLTNCINIYALRNLRICAILKLCCTFSESPDCAHYRCAILRLCNTLAWSWDCTLYPDAHVQTPPLVVMRSR